MAFFEHDGARIHYQIEGNPEGFPVLAIAPGGMRSAAPLWETVPWNPRTALADDFRIISMDQRNAGESTAPITAEDSWETYAQDQIGLLDHLGIDRFGVVGMCIGGAYIMGLIGELNRRGQAERVAAALLLQPIGLDNNRDAFYEMFDTWAEAIADQHPDVAPETWAAFRHNMYGPDRFLFIADRDDVARVTTPLLVAMGNDLYHPQSASRTIVDAAPAATLIEQWKDDASLPAAADAFVSFFVEHAR